MEAQPHASKRPCCQQRCHQRRASSIPRALLQGLFGKKNAAAEQVPSIHDPELHSWLTARGLPKQRSVVLADIPGAGRCLVASQRIRNREAVLHVPSSLVLTAHKALAGSCLQPVIQDAQLPAWSLLAVALVEMRSFGTLAGGADDWRPYARILPKAPGTILEWRENEVQQLLAGSGLLHKAHETRHVAEKTWEELRPFVHAAQHAGIPHADAFTESSIYWALGVLLSRSIRLDSLGVEALVPWADFLNHSVDANCFLEWDVGRRQVVLQVDRTYAVGDEVVVSYGDKSSGELLLSYGFCPAANTNPCDAAHLLVGLDPADPLLDLKSQLLDSYHTPSSKLWPVRMGALPAGLLQFMAFCDAAPSVAAETAELARWLFEEGSFPVLDGCSTEVMALEGLARRCNKALKGYPSSMESDRTAAAGVAGGGGFQQRTALCAGIRVKERQILARTEFVLRGQLRQLAR